MAGARLDPTVIALAIRQPWIELILRGVKTVEVRSSETTMRGTIYVYASRVVADIPAAARAVAAHRLDVDELSRGMLLGSVEIVGSRPSRAEDAAAACVPRDMLKDRFAWELANPVRFDKPEAVKYLPYGIWFYPFQRRSAS